MKRPQRLKTAKAVPRRGIQTRSWRITLAVRETGLFDISK
jgi:hypothetical protein